MMYNGFPYQVPKFQQPAVDIGQVGSEQCLRRGRAVEDHVFI